MTPEKLLKKTLDLIEKYGWVKGKLGNRKTGFCVLGAMDVAARMQWNEVYFLARRRLEVAVDARRANASRTTSFTYLATWNDAPKRRKRDVIAAFQRAIKAEHEANS